MPKRRSTNRIVLFLAALLGLGALGAKRPERPFTLCSIKTVYVAVYSESPIRVQDAVKKKTWMKVVRHAENANAVLEVHETWGDRNSSTPGQQMTVSAVLKNNEGELWSGKQSWGEGTAVSSPVEATKMLMNKLSEVAGGCK